MGMGSGGRAGVVAALGFALGVPLAILWSAWRSGSLLLLDWAPGPRYTAPLGPVPAAWMDRTFGGANGWLPIVLALAVAGVGAAASTLELRAGQPVSWVGVAVAVSAAVANPFVVTRLLAGQVGVLWAYALLFWLVRSVLRNVEHPSPRSGVAAGVLWAACVAATVHAAAIAAVPVLAGVWLRRRRLGARAALSAGAVTFAVATSATLLWVVRWSRTNAPVDLRSSDAAAVFLTRGEGFEAWLGALSGSGFWRPLPSGLLGPTAWMTALLSVTCIGAIGASRGWGRDARYLLWSSAAIGAPVALMGHGPSAAAWSWLVDHVTLVAVHREPGKWSMLPVMAAVLLAGLSVDRLHRRSILASVSVVAIAAALSAWAMVGVTRHVRPSHYPVSWEAAAARIDDGCLIAVFGDGAYVDPGFTGGRVVANPTLGFFGERALVSSDTGVRGLTAARANTDAQRWVDAVNGRYLAGGTGFAPEVAAAKNVGVGWVFVARPPDEPDAVADLTAAGFRRRLTADDGGLWQSPGGCSAAENEP